ncbi:MAG: M48 family metalloprotease [Candidatus Riflebacteria bacterium]|nr:M48 family metalloprotease [Candidatus Riflebacteria bacterium]
MRPFYRTIRNATFFLVICFFTGLSHNCLYAQLRNPFSGFFKSLLDESKAELAIGEILENSFISECAVHNAELAVPEDKRINLFLNQVVSLIHVKPNHTFRISVLKSPIPGEIPFPGGMIVLTSGLLEIAKTDDEIRFILARNVLHIAFRNTLTAMKRENLYARALKILKKPENKRDKRENSNLLRDYIKAITIVDQQRADREAVELFAERKPIVEAGISLLEKCSKMFWPALPWDWHDFTGRIENLKVIATTAQ